MRTSPALGLALLLAGPAAAQPQWTQLSPATSPGARNSTALVLDEARGVLVLYGGFRSGAGALADTWEWDGTTWTERFPASNPGVLNGHAMAYDPARGVVVLFGGARNSSIGVGETWEWDGASWTQRATAGPQGRSNHQMCYDGARGVVVLFGGHVDYNAGPDLGDTWEWNGSTWSLRTMAGPGARAYHAMAHDASRQRTVLLGGRLAGNALNDTWEWDGAAWSQRVPATSPPNRIDHEMAYDPIRRRSVVFSGFNAGADTWEWDGNDWAQRVSATSPGGRYAYGFAYDPRRHRVLLFGGYQGGQRSDTWTWGEGVPASYTTAGSGCPGSGGLPTIAPTGGSLPYLGETFSITASNLSLTGSTFGVLGFSDVVWGSIPLPLLLDFLGLTGCRLYVSLDVLWPLLNAGGSATWDLPIPDLAVLIGFRFHQQVVNASPGSNPAGVTTTNYGTGTIGVR
jgi:hypothetical protein